MKALKNNWGFTLIEVLVVMGIIGSLTMILIPQVSNYFSQTNESSIMSDFRDFQRSSEAYFRETKASIIPINEFNNFLDTEHRVRVNGSLMQTTSADPWEHPYEVTFGNAKVEFASYGRADNSSAKAYKIVTYYHNGVVDSCTYGFRTHNMDLTKVQNLPPTFMCGDEITHVASPPTVSLDAPNNFKTTQIQSNAVTLSWDTVAGATSYVLKRGGVVIYSGSNTTYSDMGLLPSVTYDYAVVAKNTAYTSEHASLSVTTQPPPSTGIETDGLIGYWHYGQGIQGTTWKNIAPRTAGLFNGTIRGATLEANGLRFNASELDVVVLGITDNFLENQSFTLEFFANLDSDNTSFAHIIGSNAVSSGIKSGYAQRMVWDITSSYSVSASKKYIAGETFQGAMVYDLPKQQVSFYLNGTLTNTVNLQEPLNMTSNYKLNIGGVTSANYAGYFINGLIMNVKVYNKALSSTVIKQHYELGPDEVNIHP